MYVFQELPFLEYALHNRLLNKLYVCGMNAVFGLKIQVSVGDTVMTGVAVSEGEERGREGREVVGQEGGEGKREGGEEEEEGGREERE